MNVLIIDDNKMTAEMVASYLGCQGHNPVVVTNEEMIYSYFSCKIDIVLMDWMLWEGKTSADFIPTIKELHKNAPIIVYSAHKPTIEQTGINRWVDKCIPLSGLMRVLTEEFETKKKSIGNTDRFEIVNKRVDECFCKLSEHDRRIKQCEIVAETVEKIHANQNEFIEKNSNAKVELIKWITYLLIGQMSFIVGVVWVIMNHYLSK